MFGLSCPKHCHSGAWPALAGREPGISGMFGGRNISDSGFALCRLRAGAPAGPTSMGWNDERAPALQQPQFRSSRRIGSGIASILAAALPRSGGASLSVR